MRNWRGAARRGAVRAFVSINFKQTGSFVFGRKGVTTKNALHLPFSASVTRSALPPARAVAGATVEGALNAVAAAIVAAKRESFICGGKVCKSISRNKKQKKRNKFRRTLKQ